MGTGFVVSNSEGNDGLNRILTARHLTEHAREYKGGNEAIAVFDSKRNFLGRAEVEAAGNKTSETAKSYDGIISNIFSGDIAVIRMRPDSDIESFRKIQGLPLAASRPNTLSQIAWDTTSTGATHGLSGAPVVNGKGEVVGVYTKIGITSDNNATWANIYEMLVDVGPTPTPVGGDIQIGDMRPSIQNFPTSYNGGVTPITDLKILASLGNAGVPPSQPMTHKDQTRVTAAGYPEGYCAAFKGTLRPD